MKTKLIDYARC